MGSLNLQIGENKSIRVYRNELKYYINFLDYEIMSRKFNKIFSLDKNAKVGKSYWIRSLYFDTLFNDDYYDKEIGIENRKKIRLRIYDCDENNVKFEIKNKFNKYMLKETAIITRDDSEQLIRGNREVLLKYDNETLNKIYYIMSKDYYIPSIVVDYEREAYVSDLENIRITFDKDVRATISNYDLFDRNSNTIPLFAENIMILEIKYNKFLPIWIKEILGGCRSNNSAISKYCISRSLF